MPSDVQMTEQKDGSGVLLSLESKDLEHLQSAQALLVKNLPADAQAISIQYDSPSFARAASPDANASHVSARARPS